MFREKLRKSLNPSQKYPIEDLSFDASKTSHISSDPQQVLDLHIKEADTQYIRAYDSSGTEADLLEPDDQYSQAVADLFPIYVHGIDNIRRAYLYVGTYKWLGEYSPAPWYTPSSELIGQSVGTTYGAVKFDVYSDTWDTLEEEGEYQILLPRTDNNTTDGGSIKLRLITSAFTTAFIGNNASVCVTPWGSVYRGSISPYNLVNTFDGKIGYAGGGTYVEIFAHPSREISFDNNGTSLKSNNVFDALKELSEDGGFISKEIPTGDIDGINTFFTLSETPFTGTEHVYVDGQLQKSGVGNDYTISYNEITFLIAPVSGSVIVVSYYLSVVPIGNATAVQDKVPSTVLNNTHSEFPTSKAVLTELNAENINYDNSSSGLIAVNVQEAIDELNEKQVTIYDTIAAETEKVIYSHDKSAFKFLKLLIHMENTIADKMYGAEILILTNGTRVNHNEVSLGDDLLISFGVNIVGSNVVLSCNNEELNSFDITILLLLRN